MGTQAGRAILDAALRIGKAATAAVAQCVQRTIAKQAIEILRVRVLVAREIGAFPILEKAVVCH